LPANPLRIGRLKSLLEQLGIVDRLFSYEADILAKLPMLDKINYEDVGDKIKKLQESSSTFLYDSLS